MSGVTDAPGMPVNPCEWRHNLPASIFNDNNRTALFDWRYLLARQIDI